MNLDTIHIPLVGTVSPCWPLPCLIEKRQGRFRYMLVLQSQQRAALHSWLKHHLQEVEALPLASKVRWSLDIDPVDLS